MTADPDTDLLVYQNVRGHVAAMLFLVSNRSWFSPRFHGLFSLRFLDTLAVSGMVFVSRGGKGKCDQRSLAVPAELMLLLLLQHISQDGYHCVLGAALMTSYLLW